MSPAVTVTECETTSLGYQQTLLGPWMPMASIGDGFEECEATPVSLTEGVANPVTVTENEATPVTLTEGSLT